MKSEVSHNTPGRLIALRQRLKLTQKGLAKLLGVCENYEWMLEKGRIPGRKVASQIRLLESGECDNHGYGKPEKKTTIYEMDSAAARKMRENSDCDLPARLVAMEGQMAEIRIQLQTILGLLGNNVREGLDLKKKAGAA